MIEEFKRVLYQNSNFKESFLLGTNVVNYIIKLYWKIKDQNKEKSWINNQRDEFLFESYTNFIWIYFENVNLYSLIVESRIINIPNKSSLSQVKDLILCISFINESIRNLFSLFDSKLKRILKDQDENVIILESIHPDFQNLKSRSKVRFLRSFAFVHIFDFQNKDQTYIFKDYRCGGFLEHNDQSPEMSRERMLIVNKNSLEEIEIYFEYDSLRDYLIYRLSILMKIYFLLNNFNAE